MAPALCEHVIYSNIHCKLAHAAGKEIPCRISIVSLRATEFARWHFRQQWLFTKKKKERKKQQTTPSAVGKNSTHTHTAFCKVIFNMEHELRVHVVNKWGGATLLAAWIIGLCWTSATCKPPSGSRGYIHTRLATINDERQMLLHPLQLMRGRHAERSQQFVYVRLTQLHTTPSGVTCFYWFDLPFFGWPEQRPVNKVIANWASRLINTAKYE